MRHDEDIGCGKGSDKGHMSGHHNGWSTCSRREFEASYLKLKQNNNWCLKPGNNISQFPLPKMHSVLTFCSHEIGCL